jgi:hypothetical protein
MAAMQLIASVLTAWPGTVPWLELETPANSEMGK